MTLQLRTVIFSSSSTLHSEVTCQSRVGATFQNTHGLPSQLSPHSITLSFRHGEVLERMHERRLVPPPRLKLTSHPECLAACSSPTAALGQNSESLHRVARSLRKTKHCVLCVRMVACTEHTTNQTCGHVASCTPTQSHQKVIVAAPDFMGLVQCRITHIMALCFIGTFARHDLRGDLKNMTQHQG